MTRILTVDDEPIYPKMIQHALEPLNYEITFAEDGEQGLRAAIAAPPDLIICDVMMPRMTGYELTARLRRDPRFAHTPILILTAQAELEEKIKAFESGADDHMTKPFAPQELVVRVTALLRRSEAARAQQLPSKPEARSHLIAVHSLRGGVGCSSLAVNLAISLRRLWKSPTLLLDLVLTAGQVALMLNGSLKRTWADITYAKPEDLDFDVLRSLFGQHESGLQFIAAPTFPSEAELLSDELFAATFTLLRPQFEYIVADLPHDFGPLALRALDAADIILMLLTPEMASIRAAVAAIDTYNKLGYGPEKIRLALNYTFERRGLPRKGIENALHQPISIVLPFAPETCVEAINIGKPFIVGKPNENISELVEMLAVQLSKAEHRSDVPAARTQS